MNANSPGNLPFFGLTGCVSRNFFLDFQSAGNGIYYASKLRKDTIAHKFNETSVMELDLWLQKLVQVKLQSKESSLLICLHQSAIPRDIGGENCCESSFHSE